MRQFEQLAERNRELGAQEAATKYEQRYEPELRALQQQVDSLRHVNRQLNEQLAQLPSEVESSRLTSQTLIADLNDQLIKLTKEKDECLRQLANYEVDEISRRSMLASSAPDQSSSDNQQLNLTQYDIDSKFWSNQSVSLSMHRTNPAPVATDGDEAVLTLAQIASTPIETISTLNNTISSSKEDQLMEELARSVALVAPLRQRCEDLETKLASANAIQSEQSAELVTYRAAMEEQSTQLSALQNNLNMRNECFEKLLAIYRCVLAEVDKTKLKIASISNTNILEELRSQLSFNEISSSEFVSAIRNILSVLLSEFESVDIEASEYTNSDVVIGDISLPSPSATFSTIISTQIEFMRLFQDYAYNSVEFIERLGVRVNNSDDQKSNRIVELTTQLQLAKSELDDMMTQLHQKETETKEFQSNVNMEVEANREQILRLRETIVSEREKIQLIGQEHEQKMLTFQTQLNAVLEQRDQAIVRAETAEADMQTEDDFSLKEEVITLTEPLQSTNTFISSINNTTDTVSATATVSADDHISTQIRQQFEHKYQAKKKILKAKLRGILQKQAGALEEQRVLITDAVRAEYEDQVTVMKEQLQKLTKTVATSSRSNSGIQFVFEDDDTAKMKQVLLYPEMLGPDVTMELVSSIARRSCSLDDFQELFHQARVNDNSNE